MANRNRAPYATIGDSRLASALAAGCAAWLTLGCATAGSGQRPDHPPPQGKIAQALPVPPVALPDPKTAERLSLDQLLAFADRHAPLIQLAQRAADTGEAEVEAASPLLRENPEIGLGLGARSTGGEAFFELEASLEQRFEVAGERGLRIEHAEQLRQVSRAQLTVARWEVHRQVHALFAAALLARRQLEAADRLVDFAEELQLIAEKRAQAGETAPLTELVARAEVAQARQARIAARQQRDAVLVQLAEVAGWPTLQLPPLDGELPPVRRAPPLAELLAKALQHQPEQHARALAVSAAEAGVRLADREAWPEPALGLSYAREGEAGGAAHVWVGTLRVPVPLWNRNQAGRARARAELGVARAERDTATSQLRARVARAAGEVDAAAERAVIYGAAIVPALDRNLQLIRRAYDLGEIDIHRVSQIRQQVLDGQQQALSALADYHQAVATLEALLGSEVWSP